MADVRWILDQLPMGVWVGRAPTGKVEYVNGAFQEIMGIGAVADSEIVDASATYGIFDRTGGLYPLEALPFSRVLASKERVMVDDLVIHRPDGRRVNVRAFGMPVFGGGGEMTHVIITFADITKEVQTELARDTFEARLAFVINHAPIAVWTADTEGVIQLSQGAGLASLGVESEQLVGQNVFDLWGEHPTIPGHIRRALAGETHWYAAEVPGAVYNTYLTPLRDAGGEIVGVAGLSNDVTELRRLQANAIQNDRVIALGTLAASVAHEINNPLTYLLAHVQFCESSLERLDALASAMPGGVGKEARSLVEGLLADLAPVRTAGERIARITGQLKSFSRSGKEERRPTDLRSVIQAVVDLAGKHVEARARLRVEGDEMAIVLGDEARLVQVILNLLVNAMQALQEQEVQDAEIVVRSRTVEDSVVVEVEDNGAGVPVSERERIFDPFFSTKAIGEGAGLGLFVCRNIVRDLEGDIIVEDRPGGGARFRVLLPADRASYVPGENPGKTQKHEGAVLRARILIVDDDTMTGSALSSALRRAGHAVTFVESGAAALSLLRSEEPFDLVYCDLMMPGTTGMDVATVLRAEAPQRLCQLVFMTGGAFTPEAQAFSDAHPSQIVSKPFDVVEETSARLQRNRRA